MWAGTAGREVVASIRGDFAASKLASTLAIGLIIGLVNSLLGVSLVSLIFTGEATSLLPVGLGVGLLGSAAVAIVYGLAGGLGGSYAGIQDASAAILGLAAGAVAASVGPAAPETILAMMATTSVATGLAFLIMARFRVGEIARFIPFPVVGGLLAGTGYLILVGALDMLEVWDMDGTGPAGLLIPGVILAGALFAASQARLRSRVYLALLVLATGGFHVITRLAGISQAGALDRGWLLGPFPDGGLWPGSVVETVTAADWGAIVGEAASLATILLVVPLTLLLYVSSLEVETRADLDLDHELRVAGWANLAAAAVGGAPGYPYMSTTVISHRILGPRRGPVLVAALTVAAIGLAGGTVLELIPQFVVGAILLFVGLDFMHGWLWAARRRMALPDYLLMVAIVVIIATVGFLPGVLTGLAAAIALFVYRYSRIDVVKHELSAREHRSNIERPRAHAEFLTETGHAVLVLELQGFVFFGTASRIFAAVKRHQLANPELRYVVFGFRLVSGVDSSAIAIFERIAHLAADHGLVVVLADLRPEMASQFAGLVAEHETVVRVEPDMDRALAWCEDELLAAGDAQADRLRPLPEDLVARLAPYLDSHTLPAGARLMSEGDPPPGMFLIERGRATVLLEERDGTTVRLRTLLEGTVLGEISLYRHDPVSATVVAETECHVLHLSPEAFDDLCAREPAVAADLHAFVAGALAARVTHANRMIRALRE